MRTIDADTLVETLEDYNWHDYEDIAIAIRAIDDAPTVEPKRGKWYRLKDCANEGTYCGHCHAKIFGDVFKPHAKKLSKFCPNCGARMEESDEFL